MNRSILIGISTCLSIAIGYCQNPISVIPLNTSLSSPTEMSNHSLYSIQTHLIDVNEDKNSLQGQVLWEDLAIGTYYLLESRFENVIEYSESLSKNTHSSSESNLLKALYYFDQKDYPTSLTYFEQFHQSKDPEISMKYGYALFANKQFATAKDQLRKVPPNSEFKDAANYYTGMASYYMQDYEEAVQALTLVDQIKPYQTYTPDYITQIYFAQGNYDQVITYGEQRISSGNARIHYLLGQSYYKKGNSSKALYHLSAYEEQTPKLTAEDFFQLGKLNQSAGNNEKALEYFSEIATMNSDISNHAKYLMTTIYQQEGKNEEAISLLDEVGMSNLNVKDNANMQAAQLSANLSNNRKALEYSDRIPSTSNYYSTAQQLVSKVLESDSDLEGSLRYLEQKSNRSDVLNDTYNRLLVKKVELLGLNGEYESIPSTLVRADKSKLSGPQQSTLNYWEGKSYFAEGNPAKSIKPLSAAIPSLNSQYTSDAYYMIGYAQTLEGNDAAANDAINKAISNSNGQDKEFQKQLYLLGANTALSSDDKTEAKKYYESAAKAGSADAIAQLAKIAKAENDSYTRIYLLESLVEQYPNSEYTQESYFELGESYVQLGKFSQAIAYYEQAVEAELIPTTITYESHLRLGLAYYNLGKVNEATEAYQLVAKNSPSGSQKLIAIEALKEVYLNDQGDPDAYFEFVESSTDLEINTVEKDNIAFTVGKNKFEAGDYQGGLASHLKYLQNYPDGAFYSDALYQVAEAYLYQKDYVNAKSNYQQYLELEQRGNHYQDAMRKSAVIALNNTSEFEDSYRYYNALIELSTDATLKKEAIDGAMFSAIKLQNGEAGRLASYIINDSSRSQNEKAKAYYHKGKYEMVQGQNDAAIQSLTQVTRMNKSNIAAEANYLVADIFYKKGNLEAAERQAKESTKRSREYPQWIAKSLLLLSDIYIDKEDHLNAQAAAEAVLENYQENAEIKTEAEEKLALIETIMSSQSRVLPSQSDTLQFLDVETPISPNNN